MLSYFYLIITDQRKGVLAACIRFFLKGMSYVYYFAIHLINFAYDKKILPGLHLGKPVISVGNITLGGVGKTPLAALLARHVQDLNLKPVILVGGYKSHRENGQSINDEALLLKELIPGVPVLVGRNRFKTARAYRKENDADVFVLDDGFQHRRLSRDLEIVALDTTNPFGNGMLIPRGILREPIHALKRADIVLLTKTDIGQANLPVIKETLRRLNLSASVVESVHVPVSLFDIEDKMPVKLTFLNGKTVCLLSAIGDPKSFECMAKSSGMNIVRHFAFRDHYWYRGQDINKVISFCGNAGIRYVITTRKDSVKLKTFKNEQYPNIRILALDISIELQNGKDKFYDRIHSLSQR